MNRALPAAIVGVFLSIAGFTQAEASPIAAYSGSYSITTNTPASEGIVSLRIRIEPLFADCTTPGQCTELLRVDGVGDADTGVSFSLNLGTMLSAIGDSSQLFAFSMNFGPAYSDAASGGGVGLFTSSLGDLYSGQPVDSATLTINRLFFSTVNPQWGSGTQATLEYTLALLGPGGLEEDEQELPGGPGSLPGDGPAPPDLPPSPPDLPPSPPDDGPAVDDPGSFPGEPDFDPSPDEAILTPEPGSWLLVATGASILWAFRRKF